MLRNPLNFDEILSKSRKAFFDREFVESYKDFREKSLEKAEKEGYPFRVGIMDVE